MEVIFETDFDVLIFFSLLTKFKTNKENPKRANENLPLIINESDMGINNFKEVSNIFIFFKSITFFHKSEVRNKLIKAKIISLPFIK